MNCGNRTVLGDKKHMFTKSSCASAEYDCVFLDHHQRWYCSYRSCHPSTVNNIARAAIFVA